MFTPDRIAALASIATVIAIVNSGLVWVLRLMISSAITQNNDELLRRINGNYVKKDLCVAHHSENEKRIARLEGAI